MTIGDRLRALRQAKKFSQEEIEERAGLLRSYVAGVEIGETVPTVETLENIACALEVSLYELFYDKSSESVECRRYCLGRGSQSYWWPAANFVRSSVASACTTSVCLSR